MYLGTITQRATAEAYGLSLLKYVDIPGPIDPFFRLGAMRVKAKFDADIPFSISGDRNYSIHYHDELSKTTPLVGLGFALRGTEEDRFILRLEERIYAKHFRSTLFSAGYRF